MPAFARYLTACAVASALLFDSSPANAKRYQVKKDRATGKITLVDPNEGVLSKLSKPFIRPVARPIQRAKTYIFGRQAPVTARGQISGFGGPLTQREMAQPSGGKVGGIVARSGHVVASAAGVPGVRTLSSYVSGTYHKVFGGQPSTPPPSSFSQKPVLNTIRPSAKPR